MHTQIIELIQKHYFLQLKFNKFINEQMDNNGYEKITKYQNYQTLVRKFTRDFGVFGGGFALVNLPFNSLIFLQNKSFNERKNKVPYTEFKLQFENEGTFQNSTVKTLNRYLIDLLLEGNRIELKLEVDNPNESPEFFHNLPPNESINALPCLPFEDELRKQKLINFLYCQTGEILFFIYGWRWLTRQAQINGLQHNISLDSEVIKPANAGLHAVSIWNRKFWYSTPDSPEKEWLNTLKTANNWWRNEFEGISLQKLLDYWENIIEKFDHLDTKKAFCFTKDWDILGLSSGSINQKSFHSLLRYTRHILRTLNKQPAFGKQRYNYGLNYVSEKSPIAWINHKIEEILSEKELDYKEILIDNLCAFGKKNIKFYHYIFRKVVFEILTSNIGGNPGKNTVGNLLANLHRKARFPIIPYYFQLILSKRKLPCEHFVFPISNNYEFPFKTKIPNRIDQPTTIHSVVLGLFMLKPIWELGKDYRLTDHANRNLDEKNAKLSQEAMARLFKVQDIIKQISQPLIDKGFYGSVVEPGIIQKTTLDYQDKISHEIKKISNSIFIKSNIEFKKLFDIQIQPDLPDGHKFIGTVQVANSDLKKEIEQWLIIPNPKRFIHNQALLNTWIGVKDISNNYHFSQSMRFSQIVKDFVDTSRKILALRRVSGLGKPQNIISVRNYERKYKEVLSELFANIQVEIKISRDLFWQPKIEFREDDFSEIQKTAFIQLLLASMVNVFEHVHDSITLEAQIQNDRLLMNITNNHKYPPEDLENKKVGTKAVLENCLRQLNGKLETFKFDSNHFLTAFSFPYRKIFILEVK